MLSILICEDEKEWAESIRTLILKNYGADAQVRVCLSKEELDREEKSGGEFDAVLMDIQLGGENGIELASELKNRHPQWQFIFVSGYIDEYLEGMFLSIRPAGVLRKPVDGDLCIRLLEKLSREKQSEQGILMKLYGGRIRKIPFKEINYFESDKRIVKIHLTGAEEQCYEKLDNLEKHLPDSFLRCHRSFLVNMDKITGFEKNKIKLSDGTTVDVSRMKMKDSRDKYIRYAGMRL